MFLLGLINVTGMKYKLPFALTLCGTVVLVTRLLAPFTAGLGCFPLAADLCLHCTLPLLQLSRPLRLFLLQWVWTEYLPSSHSSIAWALFPLWGHFLHYPRLGCEVITGSTFQAQPWFKCLSHFLLKAPELYLLASLRFSGLCLFTGLSCVQSSFTTCSWSPLHRPTGSSPEGCADHPTPRP